MKPIVYVETSVISYLTARPSRDLRTAAYQQVTRDWWANAPERFDLVASALVIREAGAGDPEAARFRLAALRAVTLLDAKPEAEDLTRELLDLGAVPRRSAEDAAHIAIAAASGVTYLVTWNFRHIANAAIRRQVERVCRQAGYDPPTICTPDELMENDNDDDTS